ncbi:arylamine N-acetyltransferase [Reichenbachiella carrageenanivorans]|uniref:Arylamine N-acetyltransferase n=1 Tax=Reichenbachiella carrageenanivorans TaxID=2979869 RepID=A0ABY6D243_9BACT|nr:arylamine N-acetyltransferase [Reichenbachiella carrageenanivorans]UXX80234.1 arylamine N-acetyltransferase [Reichenbachiella carrageenanivorans]
MAISNPIQNTPKLPSFDVDHYLLRINCPKEHTPSFKYLKQLHKAHLLHIPFENLDIHMHNEIILDIHKMYRKIILRNRGGFCYELNGLFYHLLKQLGFECHLISAKVYKGNDLGPAFDHAAILVYFADQVYLADVGFGHSFLEPKQLTPGLVQMDYNSYYKIDRTIDDEYILLGSDNSFDYEAKYLFTKETRQFVEFIDMCQYHQTNKNSHFTKKKLITQATPQGRVTLTDDKLITIIAGKKEERPILNQDEFLVKLDQHFGIKLVRKR